MERMNDESHESFLGSIRRASKEAARFCVNKAEGGARGAIRGSRADQGGRCRLL